MSEKNNLDKNIKLSDIAKMCNLSTATVSLVLSNNPRISYKTKQKVLKVIKQTGYTPNFAARVLSTNSTKTLCVVLPQISHIFSDPFFGETISGIYDIATKNGYKLLLEVATYEFCLHKRYLQLFKERAIDGMLYVGSTLKDTYLIDLQKENFPFILVGSYFPNRNPDLNYVISDNITGGYLATKHLIQHGHKKIAIITGPFHVLSAKLRYLGYKKALKENEIKFCKKLVIKANFDQSTGYIAMKKLLSLPKNERPTAVFAGNDLMALGAILAVKDSGLKVPDDIAIVGMDNIKISSVIEPTLTTVEYNVYDMGKIACEKLIELIEQRSSQRIREVLPVRLVIGQSCGMSHSLVQMYEYGDLTKRQKEVIDFIKKSIQQRGFPPTLREICKYFNFKSLSTAQWFIKRLTEKGYLKVRISNFSTRRVACGLNIYCGETKTASK